MEINPIRLMGPWDEGWALDVHTVSSECIGESPLGHKQFATVRTDMGEALYQLKYRGQYWCADKIVAAARQFLTSQPWFTGADLILPAPPSNQRDIQPAFLVAEKIAETYKKFYSCEALVKTSPQEAKDLSGVEKAKIFGSVQFVKNLLRPCDILIVDDVVSSGATLSACVNVLKQNPNAQHIYVLAITKTRSRGG